MDSKYFDDLKQKLVESKFDLEEEFGDFPIPKKTFKSDC